jgi:hypothetical protein
MVKRINRISRRQFLKIVGTGALTFGLSSLFLEGCDDLDEIVEGLLTTLINDYREQHGLPRIPVSSKLTTVALKHVTDLDQYHPENNCGGNLHSWSSHGNWTGGCYDSSNSSTWSIMWDKPKEITGYPTNGSRLPIGPAVVRPRKTHWTRGKVVLLITMLSSIKVYGRTIRGRR